MNELELINEKYNLIVLEQPEKIKFYHLKSVYNFIIHFKEIEDIESQAVVIELLDQYLDYISQEEIGSLKEAKWLFNEYIYPVGLVYKEHCGFTYFLRPQSLLVYLIILNVVFLLIKLNIYYFIPLNLIGVIALYTMYKKSLSSRVFRFDW